MYAARTSALVKQIIRTDAAPIPRIAASQATRFGNLVFTQGLTPRDPVAGDLVNTDIRSASRIVFSNLRAILGAAGSSLDNVLQLRCYIRDFDNDFPGWNEVFIEFFPSNWPARTVVPAPLGEGFRLEVDAIAAVTE